MTNNSVSLHPGNLTYVEELYETFRRDPNAVDAAWRDYFASWSDDSPLATNLATNGGAKTVSAPPSATPNSPPSKPLPRTKPKLKNGTAPRVAQNGNTQSGMPQNGNTQSGNTQRVAPHWRSQSLFNESGTGLAQEFHAADEVPEIPLVASQEMENLAVLQDRVDQMIRNHRLRGHIIARVDPLDMPRDYPPELDPEYYGFAPEDEKRLFSCQTLAPGQLLPLADILSRLRETYCRTIGVQFMHIDDFDVRDWLQRRMESTFNRVQLKHDEQIRLLRCLTDASIFEEFIRRKYTGAKSFSLEGSESLIPLLDQAIEHAAGQGVEEIVIGMAHRGRLNVLSNIIGKSAREIFREFEDRDPDLHIGGGDVKYHQGYANDFETRTGKKVHLALCFNPSHLEFVNPVAMGRLRAKMSRCGEATYAEDGRGMCLQIHGDAAFAGEGVIQETLNLSQLTAYSVGGTVHIVVNNQIGFTTSPTESRSTPYATDVAKMLQIPIFHVNGEDPEAVAAVVRLALDFRHMWKRDVVIDMYGYRKWGHNEADEPDFTQPKMYRAIKARKPVREAYLDGLLKMGEVTQQEADSIAEKSRAKLEAELNEARSDTQFVPSHLRRIASGHYGGPERNDEPETALSKKKLQKLLAKLSQVPDGFTLHPKIKKHLENIAAMSRDEEPLNWAAAEALAFASLATEGVPIRMTGQDCQRGTFSHRHAVLHDIETDKIYTPLEHLADGQAPVEIYNSPLSETAVLGFEYGYSLDCLSGLTIWEAQFGDFWNVAQPIVDQFIVSAEDKWKHLSGIIMLLPHGFEGMGPEHSSARLERFMSLAAEENIQIANPTTPAQYFHLLRRQALRPWRKPLIVMSPKSLLRNLGCVSSLDEFSEGKFQRVIPDQLERPASEVKRVLICSGKLYYELDAKREAAKRDDVAIIRYEQLYPYKPEVLEAIMKPYADGTPVFWVQEEPINMGAWRHIRVFYGHKMFDRFPFKHVTRPASASPATGSSSSHKKEQELLIDEAFGNQ